MTLADELTQRAQEAVGETTCWRSLDMESCGCCEDNDLKANAALAAVFEMAQEKDQPIVFMPGGAVRMLEHVSASRLFGRLYRIVIEDAP